MWKPEGLDLSAGPVPVFPIIYIIYRDQRIAAPSQALLCEPRSTEIHVICLKRRCSLICLACAELHQMAPSPERRCSSRTFRYGYLVTT